MAKMAPLRPRAEGFGRSLTPIFTAAQALAAHGRSQTLTKSSKWVKMAQNSPKMLTDPHFDRAAGLGGSLATNFGHFELF